MSIIPFAKSGAIVATEEVQVIGPSVAGQVVRFAPTVEVAVGGANLVLRVQDITGGSPTGSISATILIGAKVATPGVGSFVVGANATIFVRCISGTGTGLGGYFETDGPTTGAVFCTVAQLKAAAGITVTTYDSDLTLITQTVTSAMQAYMQRGIVSTAYAEERHSLAYATGKLVLNNRPIISVSQVRLNEVVVSAADYVAQLDEGVLYNESGWVSGKYHIEADYTAGYASIPPALVGACIDQCRYVWTQRKYGADRFGLAQRAEASGGSTAFIVENWYPGVVEAMRPYRRLA